MKHRYFWLSVIILSVVLMRSFTVAQEPMDDVKVILYVGNHVAISSDADFTISGDHFPPSSVDLQVASGGIDVGGKLYGQEVTIISSTPTSFLKLNTRAYRGSFLIKSTENGLKVINQLPLEEYLYGVVGKEMPGTELEALKAQAVASRTLAANAIFSKQTIHASVSQQVYDGVGGERRESNEAVDDTREEVLNYEGELVQSPLFSSTCGGKTEASEDVFGKPIPYLRSVVDADSDNDEPYCTISPYFQWTVTWSQQELNQVINNGGLEGEVTDLIPEEVDSNGRVKSLRIKTTMQEKVLSGFAIRNLLKTPTGKTLFSTWVTINKIEEGGVTRWVAMGHGQGHGVGLCQWGAIGMARHGEAYTEILKHYYVGTEIKTLSSSSWHKDWQRGTGNLFSKKKESRQG